MSIVKQLFSAERSRGQLLFCASVTRLTNHCHFLPYNRYRGERCPIGLGLARLQLAQAPRGEVQRIDAEVSHETTRLSHPSRRGCRVAPPCHRPEPVEGLSRRLAQRRSTHC